MAHTALGTTVLAVEWAPAAPRDSDAFPVVAKPSGPVGDITETYQWIGSHREDLLKTLSVHGAILLRDFGIETVEHFDWVVQSFDLDGFTYAESLSNAVRINITDRVFTANEAPPDIEIFLHHEMAQTPRYPSHLFFYCETAAEHGGATPLCRSDQLFEQLMVETPEFIARVRELGIRYTNTMPATDDASSGQGRSWRSTLGVGNRPEAEAKLNKLGYSFTWQIDGSITVTTPTLPGVHSVADGRHVFFNQLIAAFKGWNDPRNRGQKAVQFGDGSAIPDDALEKAASLAEYASVDLQWQSGDVAVVDNRLVMHGRRPFKGKRRVLVALGDTP